MVLCCWEPIDIPTNFLCSGDWQSPAVSCEGRHQPGPQSPLFSESLLHRHTLQGIPTQFNFTLNLSVFISCATDNLFVTLLEEAGERDSKVMQSTLKTPS